MNDLIANLYLFFFDYQQYQDLLTPVYNDNNFAYMGYVLIILPVVTMFIFYKLWDPVRKQLFWWVVSLISTAVIAYLITSRCILHKNRELLYVIGNLPDTSVGYTFIIDISWITVLYITIISILYSLIIKRFFSSNNSHNPF